MIVVNKILKLLLLQLFIYTNANPAVLMELSDQSKKPHVVFLISEDPLNYQADYTMPRFANMLESRLNFKVSVLKGQGELSSFHFPGLEVLSEADLVIVFCRRIALKHQQMAMIKNYLKQGKPLIGIRTANHAFSVRDEVPDGFESWWEFVPDILGCENKGYGSVAAGTAVAVVTEAIGHPILNGFDPVQWHSIGNVYHVAPSLDQHATILLTGTAEGKVEPIAWTRNAEQSKIFYTSLGYPDDFKLSQFRRFILNAVYWALSMDQPKYLDE